MNTMNNTNLLFAPTVMANFLAAGQLLSVWSIDIHRHGAEQLTYLY